VGSIGAATSGVPTVALGPLHFTKNLTINYALMLAVLLYDSRRLLSFRPGWCDLPMAVGWLRPLAAAPPNDPPPDGSWAIRDGLSQAFHQAATWGIPYLLGRLYFTDRDSLRQLALGVILAAAAYAPLCLLEVRLSPRLHHAVYGFTQHSFIQT